MRLPIVLFLLLFVSEVYSQYIEIDSIKIRSYSAADYRENKKSGGREVVDSICFVYSTDLQNMISRSVYHHLVIKFYDFDTMEFAPYVNQQNEVYSYNSIFRDKLEDLIHWIDIENYVEYIGTTTVDLTDTIIFTDFEMLIPDDYGIEYLSIDTPLLNCILEYKKGANSSYNHEETIQEYLNDFLYLNSQSTMLTSSVINDIQVEVNLSNGENYVVRQTYSGGNNCKWTIQNNKNEYEVFNPALNDLFYSILPDIFMIKANLKEYKDINRLLYRGMN